MSLRNRLFMWRARRWIAPMLDETEGDERRAADSPAEWRVWWEQRGERELRCMLMAAWDPVGVGDTPEAWDEYDNYMAGVAHRLREITDRDEAASAVAAYLDHVERDYMAELSPEGERRNRFLADTLVAWHEWSFLQHGRPPSEWIDD